MEERRLTQQEIELIAKASTGWRVGETSKEIYRNERYLANFEGLDLELLFISGEPPRNFPSSCNPYYSIGFNISFRGISLAQISHTDNPQMSEFSHKYLDYLLSRARTEAWRNLGEGLKTARDLAFRLQDI